MIKYFLIFCLIVVGLVACSQGGETEKKSTSQNTVEKNVNWLSYGNKYDEQRYSSLKQITLENVSQLKVDWELNIPDAIQFVGPPLAVEGILYFSGDRAIVRAVDGRTGQLLWTYDPKIGKESPRKTAQGWNTNRGVAYLNGKVFVGATDGRLIALDAKTGEEVWSKRTFPITARKSITGAPRAFKNMVIIGHGGAEYGTRGYMTAYHAETGEKMWRFYTVPGNPADGFENAAMEMAAETWHGDWWKMGGGGTVWNALTYDEELDQLYIGVGNGDPWDYDLRSEGKGDNLFLGSVVALNPNNGEYIWHYQMTPGERWDYKSTMDMVLADLVIDGKPRKVLMQAPTNGFFYILDRTDGELLSAEKYTKSTWAERIDMETGRPVLTDAAEYRTGKKLMYPSPFGGHNWQAMAYSPDTELVYIPHMLMGATYEVGHKPDFRDDFMAIGLYTGYPLVEPEDGSGSLLAWDPKQQKVAWNKPLDSFWNGGVLATKGGLVFQGTGGGKFAAYNAKTGQSLWDIDVQRGISSPPVTYTIDGTQHVTLLVGWGGLASFGLPVFTKEGWKYKDKGLRLISFSLVGKNELRHLDTRRYEFQPADAGDEVIDEQSAARGNLLYHYSSCSVCHGGGVVSSGAAAPDLRESQGSMDLDYFREIVSGGALTSNGMPQFKDLSDQELKDIHEYIREQTKSAEPVVR